MSNRQFIQSRSIFVESETYATWRPEGIIHTSDQIFSETVFHSYMHKDYLAFRWALPETSTTNLEPDPLQYIKVICRRSVLYPSFALSARAVEWKSDETVYVD
jgi:hypothetical protein